MERCCVCRGKAEVCSLFENWGEGIYNVYAFMSVLYSRKKKNVLLLSCSTLYWISYSSFAFKGETLWLLPLRPEKVSSGFFCLFVLFLRTGAIRQRKLHQDTSALKSCIRSHGSVAVQQPLSLGLFEPRRAHQGGSTSSVGIWHPAATEPAYSMIPPRAEPASDCWD